MTPTIYLDIDGVLNDGAWLEDTERMELRLRARQREPGAGLESAIADIDPARAKLVAGLVEEVGARVVLCSAWRYVVGYETCHAALLRHGIRLDGATQPPRMSDHHPWYRRVRPILLDIDTLPAGTPWVVLDDEVPCDPGWVSSQWDGRYDIDHARCVTPQDGVTAGDIERARVILRGGA